MRCSLSYVKILLKLHATDSLKCLLCTAQVWHRRSVTYVTMGEPHDKPTAIFFSLAYADKLRHAWFKCQVDPGVHGAAALPPWWYGLMGEMEGSHPSQSHAPLLPMVIWPKKIRGPSPVFTGKTEQSNAPYLLIILTKFDVKIHILARLQQSPPLPAMEIKDLPFRDYWSHRLRATWCQDSILPGMAWEKHPRFKLVRCWHGFGSQRALVNSRRFAWFSVSKVR